MKLAITTENKLGITDDVLSLLRSHQADLIKVEVEDGKIYLSEMNAYIREEVYDLTNGRQRPTNRAEVMDTDWRLW